MGSDMTTDTEQLVDHTDEQSYELWVGETLAGVIEYDSEPGIVELIHTEVAPAFKGRGLATRLISSAMDDIRARGLKLVPSCPFVQSFLRRHPEAQDLVVED